VANATGALFSDVNQYPTNMIKNVEILLHLVYRVIVGVLQHLQIITPKIGQHARIFQISSKGAVLRTAQPGLGIQRLGHQAVLI